VSFSGIYLAFPENMAAGISAVLPARDLRSVPKVEPQKDAIAMSVDEAVALAKKIVPDGMLLSVMLPAKPDQPYRVSLAQRNDGAPATAVFINPLSMQVMEVRDPHDYSSGEMIITWQHALHSGQGLGLAWRAAVFLIGFAPLLFSYTGISMWLAKRRRSV